MNAVHPTFNDVLAGFRATVPANKPRVTEAKVVSQLSAEGRRENAWARLEETARVILASMSIADQASLHARLRSDLAAVEACKRVRS